MNKEKKLIQKLEKLRDKVIKHNKMSMKFLDEIYKLDEIYGEDVLEEIK